MSADAVSAVVLAGSHHWSGSVFETLAPRPLVPVALEPLISYSLRWLRGAGIREATICANGTTRPIAQALGGGGALGMDLAYYEDPTPRGAAGCVRDAGLRAAAGTLVVTDGTAIPTVDLDDLIGRHRASGAAVTAVVHRDGAPGGGRAPGGVYVFDRRALDLVAQSGFQDIKEKLIPRLHQAGEKVMAYDTGGACPHVFDARTYLAVNHWMLLRLSADDARRLVDPGACIEPGARLLGPVQVAAGARVESGATVVGPTSIGTGTVVARNALLACSTAWEDCLVGEGAVVHGCVLGDQAVVRPADWLFNVVRSREQSPAARPAGANP
jgi:NDP-sugar pyrophosphorylase family protein